MSAQTSTWLTNTISFWSEGIVRACWQGSLFILLLWLTCRFLSTISPVVRHWLWWLACLKLLLILVWVTPLDLPILRAPAPGAVSVAIQHELNAPFINSLGDVSQHLSDISAPISYRLSLRSVLFALWLIGVAACASKIAKQCVFVRHVIRGSQSIDESIFGAGARQLGVKLGIRRSPRLLVSSQVTSPLLVGFFTPTIILPQGLCESLPPEEIQAVLAHELAHVRRNDLLIGIIPTVAYSVFFALPPLWLAFREWQTAREAACDAEALSITGVAAARYANLLLRIVGQDARPGFTSALGATAGYHTLKSRLQLLKARSAGSFPLVNVATGIVALVALLSLAPWRITVRPGQPTPVIENRTSKSAVHEEVPRDVADVPAQNLAAEGDANKHYVLMGPSAAPTPPDGYRLLIVLPGGDGGPDFQWFVRRVFKFALSADYIVAEPIAPVWSADQAENVVWPTQSNPWRSMKFSTEEFVDSVIRDVATRQKLDTRYVFTLGWASGGPVTYATSLRRNSPVTGAFAAMSIFHPEILPPLKYSEGRAFYILHPLDVSFLPVKDAKRAQSLLAKNGASVELATYKGGYGWYGDVYGQIRQGVRWLELHHAK